MEIKLRKIFDYQRFANSRRLSEIIDSAEQRYNTAIDDSELELVSAAGIAEDLSSDRLTSSFVPI